MKGLIHALGRHQAEGAEEARDLARILEFVGRHADPFDRRIPEGHLTASAFILAADGSGVLLLHHRKLDRWLQPGGHGERGEADGETVALREAREETGLADLRLHPAAPRPLDVDIHDFPERPGEAAHEHLDLRYVMLTAGGALQQAGAESRDLRWFAWEDLDGLELDDGLRRGLAKARRFV